MYIIKERGGCGFMAEWMTDIVNEEGQLLLSVDGFSVQHDKTKAERFAKIIVDVLNEEEKC